MCYGTRPQVIKASVLIEALRPSWPLVTIDTGQHYDYELNGLLYRQLGVLPPDHCLDVGSCDHATQTAAILTRAAAIFTELRPRGVVVIGDTNSTLGCALAAAKLRIPVVHVEAGLRAADHLMAEEINRRLVDALSAVLCAPSRTAAERLAREAATGQIEWTGDVARDVLLRNLPLAHRPADDAWPLAPGQPYVFATLHRAELTDRPAVLRGVLAGLGGIGLPVIFPVHPRTRRAMEAADALDVVPPDVHLLPPLGYLEAVACVRDAVVIVTDSGGVQREAYWLGRPCVTLRSETEWAETIEYRANRLVAPEHAADALADAVGRAQNTAVEWDRNAYGAGDAADCVAAAIERTLR